MTKRELEARLAVVAERHRGRMSFAVVAEVAGALGLDIHHPINEGPEPAEVPTRRTRRPCQELRKAGEEVFK